MEREFSAGGVVLRRMRERWWIAAIEPQSSSARRARQTRPVAALPKGLVDAGERPEQTALREVREETGLQAELIDKLADIRYTYVRSWGDGEKVFKVVSFYLLLHRTGRLGQITPAMRREVRNCQWLPLDEAPRMLSYKGEREIAKKALEYIAAHPEWESSKRVSKPDVPES
jgi:8-oxo-dGTP pyrophosphatase MutT (NUDIX family)